MTSPGKPLDGIDAHLMVCPGCGETFDMRDLEQVAKHVHDGDFEIVIKDENDAC